MTFIEYAIERSKTEIDADVRSGLIPVDVASFSELHDYVDANEYGGLCDEGRFEYQNRPELLRHIREAEAVQTAVNDWLQNDAHFTMTPWGQMLDEGAEEEGHPKDDNSPAPFPIGTTIVDGKEVPKE